jgi:hypothetical protein
MKRRPILGLATAALLCVSSAADAAVVAVRQPGDGPAEVAFIAIAGEVNSVVLRFTSDVTDPGNPASVWTVIDTDAVLVAGESCRAIDMHAVRCGPRPASGG